MDSAEELCNKITRKKESHNGGSLFTVAISGIDASGKGYITGIVQDKLERSGYRVANINIDRWQHPIAARLRADRAAENVYENIFRWNDFFEQLIFPLQKNKSIYLETRGIRTHADEYYPLVYDYKDLDILLIEGILLFKRPYLSFYDLRIWVHCSFETGMQRAIKRNAEKLETERLVNDYHIYYYAAQRLHIAKDNPMETADIIFTNDTL